MDLHPTPTLSSLAERYSSTPDTISPYLQKALNDPSLTGTVSLFNPSPTISTHPCLLPTTTNQILLYPGSFNPPHRGHLATIQYFFQHRNQLHITAFFIFCDPSSIIHAKNKKHGSIILPRSLRNTSFHQTPELTPLITSSWLHLLVGSMESHITFLRTMTDMMREDGWDVNLVGFLGGDKLSVESEPHEKPGELGAWGPVDEFLIVNVRRPVDFYVPGEDCVPKDLPGCTGWERGEGDVNDGKSRVEWVCRALTVPGQPRIRFRASESSASNGVSSTKIRKIMCEAADEELYGELKDHVLGCDLLVEWLLEYWGKRNEGQQES
ncbi:hypothetical protein N431DRAFT_510652 [Stipitochalara longipes BDJ]|nr:hypothetical protein N431DRAFT_510652 [Stipitochalara longipes BDJ]